MDDILVSGPINIETTLKVEAFPLTYEPVRYPFFGINSTVSGVGYNVAKALTVLGNKVHRPFLQKARRAGKIVATDVHTIADLADEYNRDYMAAAHILCMSDERLPCLPEEWAQRLQNRYGTAIIVIGLGRAGALLAVRDDNFMERITAVTVRPIVNTIGAGDALFSAFNHVYHRSRNPYEAIEKAVLFAGHKIGAAGAADGFLNNEELESLAQRQES